MPSSFYFTWWRHQMETFSALLAICAGNSPASGEFPAQRPVTRSFDVFFDLCLNKRLRKQSWGWWFETLSRPLWRHCNGHQCVNSSPTSAAYMSANWVSIGSGNGLSPVGTKPLLALMLTHTHIVYWTPRNKFQWNLSRNSNIFNSFNHRPPTQFCDSKNAPEDVGCEMVAILSRVRFSVSTTSKRQVRWGGCIWLAWWIWLVTKPLKYI